MKFNRCYVLIVALCWLVSCSGGKDGEEAQDSVNKIEILDSGVKMNNMDTDVVYCVSMPAEIIDALNVTNLKFKNGLIHEPGKSKNYLVQSSQALNLGIYSADLAYCAYYDQTSPCANLFLTIQDLCHKLEISFLLTDVQLMRVKNNLHQADSLKALSDEYNKSIYEHFTENKQENILCLTATGGFVESMYLVLNSINEMKSGSPVSKMIAEQKYVFEVLRDFAYQQKGKPEISIIIKDLQELDKVFSGIKAKEKEKTSTMGTNGKLVIGGKNNLFIDNTQFKELKDIILKLREKYINL
jgi:hypothetical protein